MGYTHYWQQMRDATPLEWTQIQFMVARIVEKTAVRIDIEGTTDDQICLNGAGGDEYEHETFGLYRIRQPKRDWEDADRQGWDFCKTARKPYDEVATAILIVLHSEIPGYLDHISSDGYAHDWGPGRALAATAFGRTYNIPFSDEVF